MTATGFGLLGATVVYAAGSPARQLPRKTTQLLAMLLVGRGEFVATDRIVGALWGEEPPSSARTMVREHVQRVRSVLGPADREWLSTGRNGYVLSAPPEAVDARRFESGLEAAAAQRAVADPWAAAATLREALALWRGTSAFADVLDVPALRVEATRLDERRQSAQLALAECLIERGTADAALPVLRALVEAHPDRERHWAVLMLAESALGCRPEASASYRRARRSFRDRHGMDLSADVDALHSAVLAGRSTAELARLAGLRLAAESADRPAVLS
ncbi:BTAD domain-containing putative transcriptional regulator [Actinomycetospora sp. OC33-EN08]|uniref:BTAD domain-containing putative transcriptional regulator n=1 Tax=Actinomycetospora aurantiaca TaxID=3129233 RepID=A0ABU8MWB6_9PSEU